MGNMPVIKDLIVDMDAVHWKKIQRVTPWLINKEPIPEREYIVAARVDGRRHAVDGLHPVRRLRLGLPVDGGRPAVHRPGRAGQGLPLRRRPARRPAVRAPEGPRRGPARHLRLHPLLQVHRGLPQGRGADEPDHAPAPPRRQRPPHRRPQQRRAPRGGVRHARQGQRPAVGGRAAAALLRRQLVVRQVRAARGARAARLAAGHHQGAAAPQGDADGRAQAAQDPQGRPQAGPADLRHGRGPRGAPRAQPVHHRQRRGRRRGATLAPTTRWRAPAVPKGARHEGRLLARLREPRLHPRAARLDGQGRAAARHRAGRARPRLLHAAPA